MAKMNVDKRKIIIGILVLLGGVALTVTSFCLYYLVRPLSTAVLTVSCVIDFLYNYFTTCTFFKLNNMDKCLLKGFLLSAIYTVAFIAVALIFMLATGTLDLVKSDFINIVLYSFFTGPSIFIVLVIFLVFLAYV